MYCPQCGAKCQDDAQYCSSCGSPLSAPSQTAASHRHHHTREHKSPVRGDYYEAAIGTTNLDYYLARFARFDNLGAGASWNWPAFFVSFYWLLYRKMWGFALLYFALAILVGFIAEAIAPVSETVTVAVYVGFLVGIFVWLPIYANSLYYWHVNKLIDKAEASRPDRQEKLIYVTAHGGTSSIALAIIILMAFITIISILAAIAIPAYNAYIQESRMAVIVDGMSTAEQYKPHVEKYTIENKQWPASASDVGIATMSPSDSYSLDVKDGILVVTYTTSSGIDDGSVDANGVALALIPSVNDKGYIVWSCVGYNIKPTLLPNGCQANE